MATETIPQPTRAAIEQVVHTYETSDAQTQQDIRNMLRHGLGLSMWLLPATGLSSRIARSPDTRDRAAYDEDFYAWTQDTAAHIRAGHWEGIDRETLAEEVEDLGVSQYNAVSSDLYQVLLHLLKWQYQPNRRVEGHSWRDSLVEHRDRIERLCTRSPSLRRQLPAMLQEEYPRARRAARYQTGLPLTTFPAGCPWPLEQVLDADFWPDAPSH